MRLLGRGGLVFHVHDLDAAFSSISLLTAIRSSARPATRPDAPDERCLTVGDERSDAGALQRDRRRRPRLPWRPRRSPAAGQPRQCLDGGDHVAFANDQHVGRPWMSFVLDRRRPRSRRGRSKPVARIRSEKQALVAFGHDRQRLARGLPSASERERCSNQYQPPPSAITATAASAGLRYSESVIGGSVQTMMEERLPVYRHSGDDAKYRTPATRE